MIRRTLTDANRGEEDGVGKPKKHRISIPMRILLAVCCLVLQLVSPQKMDYISLRSIFISKHTFKPTFDFHKVLVRTLEKDFNNVAGTSWWHFLIACILLLLNIYGSNFLFWVSLVPLLMALAIGAKLVYIMVKLSLETGAQQTTAQARNSLFWFKKPELLLTLLHYILFQNSYILANVVWSAWQFGTIFPCGDDWAVIGRIVIASYTQFLCGFVTLPLYALVTQMGSDTRADAVLTDSSISTLKLLAQKHKGTGSAAGTPKLGPLGLSSKLSLNAKPASEAETKGSAQPPMGTVPEEHVTEIRENEPKRTQEH